jgi:di-N-acetylchitobiase
VPFRGANCSDAAGSELGYEEILRRLGGGHATSPRQWDANQGAPYFNTVEPTRGGRAAEGRAGAREADGPAGGAEGQVVQYWFDDPQSLKAKYKLARAAGLRGVGPYTFADVASKTDPMYLAFDAFLLPFVEAERANVKR